MILHKRKHKTQNVTNKTNSRPEPDGTSSLYVLLLVRTETLCQILQNLSLSSCLGVYLSHVRTGTAPFLKSVHSPATNVQILAVHKQEGDQEARRAAHRAARGGGENNIIVHL